MGQRHPLVRQLCQQVNTFKTHIFWAPKASYAQHLGTSTDGLLNSAVILTYLVCFISNDWSLFQGLKKFLLILF